MQTAASPYRQPETNVKPLRKLAALTCGLLLAGSVLAQASPTSVNLMVPYPAGGPSDTIARTMQTPLGKALGQSVIVENLGGAGGTIAGQKVLSAPADGHHTFLGSPNEVILSPLVLAGVKYKPEDFRLVHPVSNATMVFVARKDLPANNVDELIALARKSKDKPLTYGSVGVGSLYHLVMEDVQKRKGVTLIHAPYKGNAPLVQDLGGGQVDFALLVYNPAMGAMAKEGRVKLLGQLNPKRAEALKDLPATGESQELKDFSYSQWAGIFVSKNVPQPAVERLRKAIAEALQDPKLRETLASAGAEAFDPMPMADVGPFLTSETTRYRAIFKSIDLKPQ